MILRRIAKGIKEHDWFVVTIEIMIVVVGIFIALQVDEWNDDRKEYEIARAFEDRILVDALVAIDNVENAMRNVEKRQQRGIYALNVLNGLADIDDNLSEFELALHSMFRSALPRINIGALGVILSDEEIPERVLARDTIVEFKLVVQGRLAILNHLKEMLNSRDSQMAPYFGRPLIAEVYNRTRYDLNTLRQSQEFLNIYQGSVALQIYRYGHLRVIKETIEGLVLAIETERSSQ